MRKLAAGVAVALLTVTHAPVAGAGGTSSGRCVQYGQLTEADKPGGQSTVHVWVDCRGVNPVLKIESTTVAVVNKRAEKTESKVRTFTTIQHPVSGEDFRYTVKVDGCRPGARLAARGVLKVWWKKGPATINSPDRRTVIEETILRCGT